MYSTNDFAGSAAPSSTDQELTSPYWAGSVPFGPLIAVTKPLFLASHAGSDWHCGQVGTGVGAQPGQLVEDERRPDQHGRLAGEVGGPGGVDVLGALDRVVPHQVAVEAERLDALGGVEGDLAGVVGEPAVVRQRQVLERLLGEHVAGGGRRGDAGDAAGVQLRRRGGDLLVRVGRRQAGGGEQVLAVDEQLAPPVAGYGELLAAVAGEFQRAGRERVLAEPVDDRAVGVGVDQFVGGQRAHPGQRRPSRPRRAGRRRRRWRRSGTGTGPR